MKQLVTALSTLDPPPRPGVKPCLGNSVYDLMNYLFTTGDVSRLSVKLWKCVKIKDSNDVCFYSDSYHLELDKANTLASVCSNAGLDVRIFEWHYPRLHCQSGYFPPKTAEVMGTGHEYLYRGKLVGFVVGAYNNPHEKRTTKGSCTRKRRRGR